MTWLILAFGSVVFFTSLDLLQRVLAVDSENPRATAILFNAIAAAFSLLIYVFSGSITNFILPTEPKAWIALSLAVFFYAMFERGRFVAAKLLDASILVTIINISVLIAFVGSLFLYSETLTVNKTIGAFLVIGALFLVSYNRNAKKVSRKGLLVGVVISVMLGLAWMLDKMGTFYFNADTYNILVWTIPLVFIYFPAIKLEILKAELKRASWKMFVLSGLNVVGYLLQLKALEIAEATKVIPIVQTTTLFTVLLGVVVLKERDRVYQKLAAGAMAVIGVYFLI